MKLNHTHVLAAGLTAAALAGLLLGTGARAQELATDSGSATAVDAAGSETIDRSLPPPYLVIGNPGCYWLAGDCVHLQCNSQGAALYSNYVNGSPCPANHICAGGMAFQKGVGGNYGPWYIFVPKGVPEPYKRLAVRFRSSFTQNTPLATFSQSSGWTLVAPAGTYYAQQLDTHPTECW